MFPALPADIPLWPESNRKVRTEGGDTSVFRSILASLGRAASAPVGALAEAPLARGAAATAQPESVASDPSPEPEGPAAAYPGWPEASGVDAEPDDRSDAEPGPDGAQMGVEQVPRAGDDPATAKTGPSQQGAEPAFVPAALLTAGNGAPPPLGTRSVAVSDLADHPPPPVPASIAAAPGHPSASLPVAAVPTGPSAASSPSIPGPIPPALPAMAQILAPLPVDTRAPLTLASPPALASASDRTAVDGPSAGAALLHGRISLIQDAGFARQAPSHPPRPLYPMVDRFAPQPPADGPQAARTIARPESAIQMPLMTAPTAVRDFVTRQGPDASLAGSTDAPIGPQRAVPPSVSPVAAVNPEPPPMRAAGPIPGGDERPLPPHTPAELRPYVTAPTNSPPIPGPTFRAPETAGAPLGHGPPSHDRPLAALPPPPSAHEVVAVSTSRPMETPPGSSPPPAPTPSVVPSAFEPNQPGQMPIFAPTAASGPVAPMPTGAGPEMAQGITHQIAGQTIGEPLVRVLAAGSAGFDVALAPEELGSVRLRLINGESGSVLLIQTERPETLELLRRHVATLEQDLKALGHDALSVRFASSGFSGNGFGQPPNGAQTVPGQGQQAEPAPRGTTDPPERSMLPADRGTPRDDHLDLRL